MPTSWCLESPQHLVERDWDGEIIVLNTLTGDTHLLAPVAAVVYRCLQRCPQSANALTAQLSDGLNVDDLADARASVEATLLEFSRLGLIAPTSIENC